jgi:hypothetical protein
MSGVTIEVNGLNYDCRREGRATVMDSRLSDREIFLRSSIFFMERNML